MPRRARELEIDDEEETDIEVYGDDDSNSDVLKTALDFLQKEAVDNSWDTECEGWSIINSIRRALEMPTVSIVDEPDHKHFNKR